MNKKQMQYAKVVGFKPEGTTRAEIDAEVQVLANDVGRMMGADSPPTTIGVDMLPVSESASDWSEMGFEVLKRFKAEMSDHVFVVVSMPNDGAGVLDVTIHFDTHAYQVWPADPTQAYAVPPDKVSDDRLFQQIIMPFLTKCHQCGIGQAKLDEFIAKCDLMNSPPAPEHPTSPGPKRAGVSGSEATVQKEGEGSPKEWGTV